jgi:hypothetical protein
LTDTEIIYSEVLEAHQFVMGVPLCTLPKEIQEMLEVYCTKKGIGLKSQFYGNSTTLAMDKHEYFKWVAQIFYQGLNSIQTKKSTYAK